MSEDLTKQNRYLKIYAVILSFFTVFSAYFSFVCYSQINLFSSHIEEMDKKFIASSKKINNLIDENLKINQKVTDITEKTDKKINEIKIAADNKEKLLNDLSSPEKIKAFQATQGLPQTGKIGPRTRKAILLLKR